MKRSIKAVSCICAAVMAFSGMAVMSFAADETSVTQTVTAESTDSVKIGKVTSADGNTITVSVGGHGGIHGKKGGKSAQINAGGTAKTRPEKKSADEQTDGTAKTRPEKKSDGGQTDSTAKTHPEKKSDGGQTDGTAKTRPEKKEFKTKAAETVSITIGDESIIKKNGAAASLSDITAGSVVKLTYNADNELTSVEIIEPEGKGSRDGKGGRHMKDSENSAEA